MGRYANELSQLQGMFDKVIGKAATTGTFLISMRIYEALNSHSEFKGYASELLGRMEISVTEAVYAEDKEAVETLADTIVGLLLELYDGVRQYMSVADAETFIKHAASRINLKLDL